VGTKRMQAALSAVCITTLLFPGTLTASGVKLDDQAPSDQQSGTATGTAPPAQAATQQDSHAASASPAPPQNANKVCAVTADTAPPLSAPLAAALKLYRTGKFDEAISAYNAIVPEGGSDAAAAYAGLARVYLEQRNPTQAYSAAQKAVALTPDRAPAIVALGEVYFRQGKLEEAQAAFSKPLRACDLDARAFLGLNQLYTVSLNWKHAKSNIEQAYKLDPDDPEIQRVYMSTLSGQQRIDALKGFLANASDNDTETRDELKKELNRLQAESDRPKSACRLATPVKSTEAKLEPLFDYPKHIRGYGLTVKVNGVSSRLLLDTGASGILIDRKIAEKAGVKSIREIHIGGFGDQAATAGFVGHADKIQIGGLEFDDCLVQVAGTSSVADGDGLIGANVFSHFLVDIYMPDNKMKLSELPPYPDETTSDISLDSRSSSRTNWHDRYFPPAMKDYTPVFEFGHGLLIPTSVNSSSPRLFLIDTGAFDNQLSLAEAKEVTRIAADYESEVKGLSGKVKKVYNAQNATIQFANVRQQREDLIAIDMSHISDGFGTEISGVLGFQMLWMLHMKIDYRDGLVNFTADQRFVQ
jgi:tetratricopeptide (TPR) repeat protein/predicted aspartyl protease